MKLKTTSLAATLLTATATLSLAFAGSLSASADGPYAPPAATSTDLSFVVPLTDDPAQTSVDVLGEIEDKFLTDDLANFSVNITCPGIAPIDVVVTPGGVQGDIRYGQILYGAMSTRLPKTQEGKTCVIHSTSVDPNRALLFSAPSTKPGETGDTSRLYFLSSVVLKVTTRGGAY